MFRSFLLFALLATPLAARAADWTPAAWADQSTVELTTVGPTEGPHTFPGSVTGAVRWHVTPRQSLGNSNEVG